MLGELDVGFWSVELEFGAGFNPFDVGVFKKPDGDEKVENQGDREGGF